MIQELAENGCDWSNTQHTYMLSGSVEDTSDF